jgi:hypothetical protein
VQAANAAGKDFAIGEFSSVSCSGKENVTDTYGQALWLADSERFNFEPGQLRSTGHGSDVV